MATEEFQDRLSSLEREYNAQREQLWNDLRKEAQNLGFILEASQRGIISVPIFNGKRLTPQEFEGLPDEIKEQFRKKTLKD